MKTNLLVFIAMSIILTFDSAMALCKNHPTKGERNDGENRTGAIGEILDEHGVPLIEDSSEQDCVPDRDPMPKVTPGPKPRQPSLPGGLIFKPDANNK
jgi:hypothetical protein